jgi:hypothetical protein
MRTLAIAVVCLLIGFVSVTWWALESDGVAVIETKQPDGQTRSTHVWWVEAHGLTWLEAGAPTNGWFVDIGSNPGMIVRRNDEAWEYVAVPIRDESHHEWIRSEIRKKYGFRDWWVSWLVDTSESVAVSLVPPENFVSQE